LNLMILYYNSVNIHDFFLDQVSKIIKSHVKEF